MLAVENEPVKFCPPALVPPPLLRRKFKKVIGTPAFCPDETTPSELRFVLALIDEYGAAPHCQDSVIPGLSVVNMPLHTTLLKLPGIFIWTGSPLRKKLSPKFAGNIVVHVFVSRLKLDDVVTADVDRMMLESGSSMFTVRLPAVKRMR